MDARISDVKHLGDSAHILTLAVSQLPEFFTWLDAQSQQIVNGGENAHLMVTPYETGMYRAVATKLYETMEYLNSIRNTYEEIVKGAAQ